MENVEWAFTAENPLMEASNGSALLPLFCNTWVAWTDNILVPSPRWGNGVRVGDWDWLIQPGFLIRADVTCRSIVPARLSCLTRSPLENARATAHHICDACLRKNCLALAQNVLYTHKICDGERVNRSDDDWDDLGDEPADQ